MTANETVEWVNPDKRHKVCPVCGWNGITGLTYCWANKYNGGVCLTPTGSRVSLINYK